MPKKNMTPEERKAFGAKMKAAREAKKIEVNTVPDLNEQGESDLRRQVEALTAELGKLQNIIQAPKVPETPTLNSRGTLIGTFEKYVLDPANYPDPSERLSNEPRLKRFAFKENYELDYRVASSSYETKTGINTVEPRFELDLLGIIFDEETGEPTNKRYIMRKLIFHEDPQAAIFVARKNGFPLDSIPEKDFLNEMRYLRTKEWLMNIFYPQTLLEDRNNRTEQNIGGRIVEVFEISSASGKPDIPFHEVTKKG